MEHQAHCADWKKDFYASAAAWWGESWYGGENLPGRLALVQQFARPQDHRLLELGAGTGETAAYLCDHGFVVTAVDLCRENVALIQATAQTRPGLRAVEGDFLSVPLAEKFPLVCMFETFGMGSDRDQKRLLRRIRREWLEDGGTLILDVYHPSGPIKAAGSRLSLDRLENVPGSVDMTEYSHYDGVLGRWMDTWEPVQDPASARTQSIRCYTPADFLLLLSGSGLRVRQMLFQGQPLNFADDAVRPIDPFAAPNVDYTYTVILQKAGKG